MRANVLLNPDLLNEAMQYVNTKSKGAIIDQALRVFIQVKAEERRRETYQERLVKLQARLAGLRFREGAHQLVRLDRQR